MAEPREPRRARATEVREESVAVPTPPARPFWPWLLLLLLLVLGALAASWYFTNRDETVEAENVPVSYTHLTLPRLLTCRSRWSPYH